MHKKIFSSNVMHQSQVIMARRLTTSTSTKLEIIFYFCIEFHHPRCSEALEFFSLLLSPARSVLHSYLS